MFDLIPFASSWGKVTDRDGQSCLVGQLLQLQLAARSDPKIVIHAPDATPATPLAAFKIP